MAKNTPAGSSLIVVSNELVVSGMGLEHAIVLPVREAVVGISKEVRYTIASMGIPSEKIKRHCATVQWRIKQN